MAGVKANRIVVPFDFSNSCLQAVKQAVDCCSLDGTVTVIHALEEFFPVHPSEKYPAYVEEKHRVLCERKIKAALNDAGIVHDCIDVRVVIGRIGAELIQVIKEHQTDLVLMPSHCRKGLSRVWLGSVAEYVTRRAPCPVMILKHSEDGNIPSLTKITNVLVPFDFSDTCIEAVKDALAIVGNDAPIDVLHVLTESYPVPMRTRDGWEHEKYRVKAIKSVRDALNENGIPTDNVRLHVVHGDAGREIVDFAGSKTVDLVVMPSHGRGGFQRLVLGSVAERVTRNSPRPVLIMKSQRLMDDAQLEPNPTTETSS